MKFFLLFLLCNVTILQSYNVPAISTPECPICTKVGVAVDATAKPNAPTTDDPTSTDPKRSPPTPTDPTTTDSTSTDPTSTDPKRYPPKPTDPTTSDSTSTDPTTTDLTSTDPKRSSQKPTDPTTTDSTSTDPTSTDPTSTDPIRSSPKPTDPTTTDSTTTDPTTADPTSTDPTSTDPKRSSPKPTDPTTTDSKSTDPTTTTDTTSTDPTSTDPNPSSPKLTALTPTLPTSTVPTTTAQKQTSIKPTAAISTTSKTTTQGPFVYSYPEERQLVKDTLVSTIPKLGKEWRVTFDFFPTNYNVQGWANGFALTTSGDEVILFIRYHPSCHSHGGRRDCMQVCFQELCTGYMKTFLPKIDKWTSIQLDQELVNGQYINSISLSGTKVPWAESNRGNTWKTGTSYPQPQPTEFSDVKVFASQPGWSAQPGSIRNIVVETKIEGE